jgi:hypothetical protein
MHPVMYLTNVRLRAPVDAEPAACSGDEPNEDGRARPVSFSRSPVRPANELKAGPASPGA